ncbi:type VI secretion system tube protein TssD [Taibaiella soli]|uniref:Phage tail protein n=1 Tax=Taibaiella soli TaxID=1649169 RepID=A0A2W2ABE2_9BACT|nr:type VI secretion system tube protein TssD [Taibaiella soli]PZF72735.1 hypothetical protein DN068_12815 [Taibaiella soli]
MSSFKSELVIDGTVYPIRHCSFNYLQNTRIDGVPKTKVRGGTINITLQNPAPKEMIQWIMNPTDKKEGSIRFYEVNVMAGSHQVLEFGDAYCIQFGNSYTGENHNSGSLTSCFTLNAQLLSFDGVDFNQ